MIDPSGQTPYLTLPAPLAGDVYRRAPPFSTIAQALTYENLLPPAYYKYLTTGEFPSSI